MKLCLLLSLGALRCHDATTTRTSKSNKLNRQNNNSARASRFFSTFLYRHCTITTGKCLISSFLEDVNKRGLNFLSLSELEYDSKKFGATEEFACI